MSKKINIIGIDERKTRKSEKGTETMCFYIELSKTPSSRWENLFLEERKNFQHHLTIKFEIDNRYIVINTIRDELEFYLKELEKNIEDVNKKVDGLQRI